MLRVQLGCERRFTIEFYGADSHFCHSAYVTWSYVPASLSHFCCRTQFVRRDGVTYVSSALQTLSVVCRKTYCLCRQLHWNQHEWNFSPSTAWGQKPTWDNVTWRYACVPPHMTWAQVTWWQCVPGLSVMSVRPHGTTWLSLDGLPWNSTFRDFSNICRRKLKFH